MSAFDKSSELDNKDGGRSSTFMKPNNKNKRVSRSGSFIKRMRLSFTRSGGERGAGVEALRGTTGADWEGRAILSRDPGGAFCGCLGGGGGGDKDRLLLIKGPFCFVFGEVTDSAPKYAISLCHMSAVIPDASNDKVVHLETTLGEVEYVITFENSKSASGFKKSVTEQAAKGETEAVRKRLGHERLLTKRSSVRYAESVALSKVGQQPEKNIPIQSDNFANVAVAGL